MYEFVLFSLKFELFHANTPIALELHFFLGGGAVFHRLDTDESSSIYFSCVK